MDTLTEAVFRLFLLNFEIDASDFNELEPQEQYRIFNDLKFLVRSHVFSEIVTPGKVSNEWLLRRIDRRVEDILFG